MNPQDREPSVSKNRGEILLGIKNALSNDCDCVTCTKIQFKLQSGGDLNMVLGVLIEELARNKYYTERLEERLRDLEENALRLKKD